MELSPQLMRAKVMHHRLQPVKNLFHYGVYYMACPIEQIEQCRSRWFSLNRFNLLSLHFADHGKRDGSDPRPWLREQLAASGMTEATGAIMLVTLPRVLGYVFNPVSFWLCFSAREQLIAVVAEVNNTDSETHSYLLAHADQRPIEPSEWLASDKVFYVSPFLSVEGTYRFRFQMSGRSLGIWIDHDITGEPVLLTALTGTLSPWSPRAALRLFWQIPLVTIKVITLIHWQAVKLRLKGLRLVAKPNPPAAGVSKWLSH